MESVVDEARQDQPEIEEEEIELSEEARTFLGKFKIPPRTVLSDDCPIVIDARFKDGEIVDEGTTYHPHEGEHVWVLPVGTFNTFLDLAKFRRFRSGDAEDFQDQVGEMEKRYRALATSLANIVVYWDWTDVTGESLPQPYKAPDVLMALETDELLWLLSAAQGETPGERKNVLRPSVAISSARARRRRK